MRQPEATKTTTIRTQRDNNKPLSHDVAPSTPLQSQRSSLMLQLHEFTRANILIKEHNADNNTTNTTQNVNKNQTSHEITPSTSLQTNCSRSGLMQSVNDSTGARNTVPSLDPDVDSLVATEHRNQTNMKEIRIVHWNCAGANHNIHILML